jgi:hypothetical protein
MPINEALKPAVNDFMIRFAESFNNQTGLKTPQISYIRSLYPVLLGCYRKLALTHKLQITPNVQPLDLAREKVKNGVNIQALLNYAQSNSIISPDVAQAAGTKFNGVSLSTSEFDVVSGNLMACTIADRDGPIENEILNQLELGQKIPESCITCRIGLNMYKRHERGTRVRCPLLFEILRKVMPEMSFKLNTRQAQTNELPLFNGIQTNLDKTINSKNSNQRPSNPQDLVPKFSGRIALSDINVANTHLGGNDESIREQGLSAEHEILSKYTKFQAQGMVDMFSVVFRTLATQNRLPNSKDFKNFFPSGVGEQEERLWGVISDLAVDNPALNSTYEFKEHLWKTFKIWKSGFYFKNNLFTNYTDIWHGDDTNHFVAMLLNSLGEDVEKHFAEKTDMQIDTLFETQTPLTQLDSLRFENDPRQSKLLIRPTLISFIVLPHEKKRFQIRFKPGYILHNESSQIILQDDFFYPKETRMETMGEKLMRFIKESTVNMYLMDTKLRRKPPSKPFYYFYPDQLNPGKVQSKTRKISKNGEFIYRDYSNLSAEREKLAEELSNTLNYFSSHSEYIKRRNPKEQFEEFLEI